MYARQKLPKYLHVALISRSSFIGQVKSYFDRARLTDRASAYMNCVLNSVANTRHGNENKKARWPNTNNASRLY